MPYLLIWSDEIQKDLSKMEKYIAQRIFEKVGRANQTNTLFLEKVQGSDDYKYRVGQYRVFFSKKPENKLFAKGIEHRKKAYKK